MVFGIHEDLLFEEMVRRLNNITTRGIVLVEGQGLFDMYNQRVPGASRKNLTSFQSV
jgi:hypothetical protein